MIEHGFMVCGKDRLRDKIRCAIKLYIEKFGIRPTRCQVSDRDFISGSRMARYRNRYRIDIILVKNLPPGHVLVGRGSLSPKIQNKPRGERSGGSSRRLEYHPNPNIRK